jgi:hypothetical protein
LTNNTSKVSLTLDSWTSNNNIAFVGTRLCHGKSADPQLISVFSCDFFGYMLADYF